MRYADDIPLDLAIRAHAGTSHVPERRGEQEREDYARTLEADWQALSVLATTDDKRATLVAEWPRYREGYRKLYLAALEARSRCVSTMIAGGSGFNVRRAQKRSDAADNRARRPLEYRTNALGAIRKALTPELAPIMAGDADAMERLELRVALLEKARVRMKAANVAIRKHAKAGSKAQIKALQAIGFSDEHATALVEVPNFAGRSGFDLTSTTLEIKRVRARLEALEAVKAQSESATEGEHARLEDSPADNRVRLFFPGKPDAETIAKLKRSGFKWSPKRGAWSAFRTRLHVAQEIAGAAA